MIGGVLSTTVTCCVAVAVLPAASVAFHVTVVVPMGKKFPAGTPVRETETEQPPSSASARPKVASLTTTPHVAPSAPVDTLTSGGAVMVGGVVSLLLTVTVCVHEAERPTLSVAVHVIVVVPTGNGSLKSLSSLRSAVTVAPLLAVGVPGSTVASQPSVIVVVTGAGQGIVGRPPSPTVMLKLQEPPPVEDVEVTTVVPTGKKSPEL